MERMIQDAQRMLTERRQMLLGTLEEQTGEDAVHAGEEPRERVAGAAEEEMRSQLADRELIELREIEAALRRITEGTYGHCERCNGAIGKQRLRAVPEARLCLTCTSQRPAARSV